MPEDPAHSAPAKRRRGNPSWVKGGPSPNPSGGAAVQVHADAAHEGVPVPSVVSPYDMPSPHSGHLVHRTDGWESALTSIGTINDKRSSHSFRAKPVRYFDAIEIWRGDAMCQKAIELVPDYIFGHGYDLDFGPTDEHDDLKQDVLDKIEDLGVDESTHRALCLERGVGGGAILMGINDGRPLHAPLNENNVQSFDWLSVIEPVELLPYTTYADENDPKFGEPELYQVSAYSPSKYGAMFGVTRDRLPPPATEGIHESRLIIFPGERVSRYQNTCNVVDSMWGDSKITRFYDALRDFNLAMSSAGIIVTDFSQSVIKIEGLIGMAMKNEKALVARMKALELGRSVANAMIVDAKEDVQRQTTNVSGLPDLMDRLSMRLGADIDVPLSVLLGLTSKSLGIDPMVEMELFRDKIRAMQRRRVSKIMKRMIRLIIKALRQRGAPKRWKLKWNSLVTLTDKDHADLGLTVARTMSMLAKTGIATSDEIRKAVYNHRFNPTPLFDASKKAPGFVVIPPHGLPGSPQNPGPGGAPGAKSGAAPALNAHPVAGYARKNPIARGTEAAPKEGGDHAPGGGPNSRKDGEDFTTVDEALAIVRAVNTGPNSPTIQQAIAAAQWLLARGWGTNPEPVPRADDRPAVARRVFAGFNVVIEKLAGAMIPWTDRTGKSGETLQTLDYGYLEGVPGDDGDSMDVFLGPNEAAEWVYVIAQNAPPDFTEYDEEKVLLGFDSADAARAAYVGAYGGESRFFRGMRMLSMAEFRASITQT